MNTRPTIADVARVSGLSRSTIDRVLNNRAGVRAKTREEVESALRDLGYQPDALAGLLKQRPRSILALLPAGLNPFFEEIEQAFAAVAAMNPYRNVPCRSVDIDPYANSDLLDVLKNVPDDVTQIICIGQDTPEMHAAIDRLKSRDIDVVTLISDVPNSKRKAFVGQDSFRAGRTAGRLMASICSPGDGEVGMMVGHVEYRHLLDRQAGFIQNMNLVRPDLRLLQTPPYGTSAAKCEAAVDDLLTNNPNLKGVYLTGGGHPALFKSLFRKRAPELRIVGHELNKTTRDALLNGRMDAVVGHNTFELVRAAFDAALSIEAPANMLSGIGIYMGDNIPPESIVP